MEDWQIHYANACGQLDGLIDEIGTGIANARQRVETETLPISIDVIVQVRTGSVIEEMGFVGHAPTGTMVYLTFDPDNLSMKQNMGDPLERTIAHELHHVHRWRGPGYGRSLGEALVSEGLAGQFCKQLYQSPPELWEHAVTGADLADCANAAKADWDTTSYDHGHWFFGHGNLPRWAGYSLGYALVGHAIKNRSDDTAASLVHEPAAKFRNALEEIGK